MASSTFLHLALLQIGKTKSSLFLSICFWRFFSSWNQWIINKLISLYSSIFGDLKCSLKCIEKRDASAPISSWLFLEILALRYLEVFEIHLLFSWEFLMTSRCSQLILPNALFMFRPSSRVASAPPYELNILWANFFPFPPYAPLSYHLLNWHPLSGYLRNTKC